MVKAPSAPSSVGSKRGFRADTWRSRTAEYESNDWQLRATGYAPRAINTDGNRGWWLGPNLLEVAERVARSSWLKARSYLAALDAIFFTIASTSLRSLSFRLVEYR